MELIIVLGVVLAITVLVGKGRKPHYLKSSKNQSNGDNSRAATDIQRRQEETDELITVILPIINDK
jgi:hypothetical protein